MSKIYGINNIDAAIDAKTVKKIYVTNNFVKKELLEKAKKNNVEIEFTDKKTLSSFFPGVNHQNIVADVRSYLTYSLEDILFESKGKEDYYVAILDELTDPQNLGAILRSSDIFGIQAIIYKKDNSVKLSPLVGKISAGAINYVKCVEVTNLSRTIEKLKENRFWVIGLAGEAKEDINNIYKDRNVAIVIGNEGKGISKLVKEKCDILLKIPQYGRTPCLNASNAAAIAFYELRRKL